MNGLQYLESMVQTGLDAYITWCYVWASLGQVFGFQQQPSFYVRYVKYLKLIQIDFFSVNNFSRKFRVVGFFRLAYNGNNVVGYVFA